MSTHQHSDFVPDPSWPSIVELAIERWGQPTKTEPTATTAGSAEGEQVDQAVRPDVVRPRSRRGRRLCRSASARRGPLPRRPEPTNGGGGKVPPWENIGDRLPLPRCRRRADLDVVRTRTGTPRFLQRAPDGHRDNGELKWRWCVKHIPNHDMLLYRLPGLRASGDATVWITEGEKDADRLHR